MLQDQQKWHQAGVWFGTNRRRLLRLSFLAHTLIYLLVAGLFVIYAFHSYHSREYVSSPYQFSDGDGLERHFQEMPLSLAMPIFWPGLLLLFGWGLGLLLHFLAVFVAFNVPATPTRSASSQFGYYGVGQPQQGWQSDTSPFDEPYRADNSWPPPPGLS